MPARNSIKKYSVDSYYHVYNRGVEKREIFLDDQDKSVFLSYLKNYLLPKDTQALSETLKSKETSYKEKAKALQLLGLNNFSGEIELHAYCLMPNHFHLLIKQKSETSMDTFMNSLGTRYTMYFNQKYHRVGKLYQGVYKAVFVETDEQLLHLSRYIHLNPIIFLGVTVENWNGISIPNSLPEYLGQRNTGWIITDQVLSYFKRAEPRGDYFSFLKVNLDLDPIKQFLLDFEDY